jgi:plasmid maintenance system antidote protein VapI
MTLPFQSDQNHIVLGHTPGRHVAQVMALRCLSTQDLADLLDISQLAAKDFIAGHFIVTGRLADHLEAAFGIPAHDWVRWDKEARAREACREALHDDDRLAHIFALEQAWWARQQAWGRVVRKPSGADQNEAWTAWLAACADTEKAANVLAGDETGLWRTAFYNEDSGRL